MPACTRFNADNAIISYSEKPTCEFLSIQISKCKKEKRVDVRLCRNGRRRHGEKLKLGAQHSTTNGTYQLHGSVIRFQLLSSKKKND